MGVVGLGSVWACMKPIQPKQANNKNVFNVFMVLIFLLLPFNDISLGRLTFFIFFWCLFIACSEAIRPYRN